MGRKVCSVYRQGAVMGATGRGGGGKGGGREGEGREEGHGLRLA